MFEAPGPETPAELGPYQPLARLGAGGMGEVYLARARPGGPQPPGTLTAIKTVRRELAADPVFRSRFRRELRLARAVSGDGVAKLVDGDAEAAVPWLATEYVPGPSLAETVRRTGPLPAAAVRALGRQLAAALTSIHAVDVLHRDLKPGNVLLAQDGARVIDFGIARAHGLTTLTATGAIVGTPGFMSPEHLTGGDTVVPASDVFCLGALLAYAASGRGPFGTGQAAVVLYRIAEEEPELSGIAGDLRDVIADCLAKDPARRPTTADLAARLAAPDGQPVSWPAPVRAMIAESADAVRQLAADATTRATGSRTATRLLEPPTAPQRGTQPDGGRATGRGRRSRGVRAAVVVLLAVAALAGGYLSQQFRSPPADASTDTARDPGHDAAGDAPADADETDGAGPPPEGLHAGIDDSGGPDRNGIVPQHASQRPDGWAEWQTTLPKLPMGCAAVPEALVCWLSDGSHLALDTADGSVLWQTEPGDEEAKRAGAAGDLATSPGSPPQAQGDQVFFASPRGFELRDVRTGELSWQVGYEDADLPRPPYRAVLAGELAIAMADDAVVAYERESGEERWNRLLTGRGLAMAERRSITFSVGPFANGLLYARDDHGLIILDPENGITTASSPVYQFECQNARALGESVYCNGPWESPGSVYRHDARTVAAAETLVLADGAYAYPDVKAVSDLLLLAVDVPSAELLVLDSRTGQEHQSLPFTAADGDFPAVLVSAPKITEQQVVFADNERLYTVPVDDPAAEPSSMAIPGAPGDREAGERREVSVWAMIDVIRPPELLPLGGVAYVVFDEGTVASVELPSEESSAEPDGA